MGKVSTFRARQLQPAGPSDSALDSLRSELGRLRLAARARAEKIADDWRSDHAAKFTRRALEALARKAAPDYELVASFCSSKGSLDEAMARLADAMGASAASLPRLESLHFVTSLYPALLPANLRGVLGAYYTPPALASRLLDRASEHGVDWLSARVLDPAAGGGAFLIQVAQRMRDAMSALDPAVVLTRIGLCLLGLELDRNAATLAQAALEILLSDLSMASGMPVPALLHVCDTLEEVPRATFDLVVGNPPYGRTALSDEQRQRFARGLYGHANLYGVFTDIALRWTRPNGLIAYLTPTSFLAGQYYSALRGLLAQEAPPVAIDFVHARRGVFEDVLQETLLAVYRKGSPPARAQIHYLDVPNENIAKVTRNGTIGLPPNARAPWLAPRVPEHSVLIAGIETMTGRLADWGYSVSTGPLVWNRFKTQLRQTAQGKRVHPLIWAEAVTAEGEFVFRAEKKNHAPYFALEPGDDWLLVEKPCVLVQRTTAKEQSRRLIAAELPASFVKESRGVVVENHLNMIRSTGHPKVDPAVVAALLNSRVADQVFRCMSGSVAVSAFELEALPLPQPEALEGLRRLVLSKAERSLIDAECDRLYGACDAVTATLRYA